jgi:hypothetical protein
MAERFAASQLTSLSRKGTRLRAIANNAIELVKQAQEQVAENIVQDLKDNYATAEPGETYERTGDMGASWEIHGPYIAGNGNVQTDITNIVTDSRGRHYSGLVQGPTGEEGTQTFRHEEAGWRSIDDIKADHIREQTNRVRGAINRAGR